MGKASSNLSFPKHGNKRVIIKNVLPAVNCGRYPAKAAIGFPVKFSAAIFTDGSDAVVSILQYRYTGESEWRQIRMSALGNDFWQTHVVPERTGQLEFRIKAWVSEIESWLTAFQKKYDAGIDTEVEEQSGKAILKTLVKLAGKADREALKNLETYYSDKRLAPGFIDAELLTRLSLLAPAGKVSSSEVFLIHVERKKAQFSTWYELFPRSCATEPGRHGNFRDVAALLPGIARAGFDVLYLPPVHPIGKLNRKGKNNCLVADQDDPGSPWAIGNHLGGHKSLHPELGDMDDFRYLVAEAKAHHIELAMDIALQCAPDHPYVKEHPEWFRWRPDGTVQYAENPPKKYEDILPLDFESASWQTLWTEILSIFKFWADEGIRIFRVDNPHTKSMQMWEWLALNLQADYPEVILLAEAFTRPNIMEHLAMSAFSQSYTYFTWRETKQELERYLRELTAEDKQYFFRPNFWPNTPDILPGHLVEGGEHMHVIRLLLAATLSSNYGIYGPVYERGINKPMPAKEEYADNEKYEIKYWVPGEETRIAAVIRQVNHIRHQHTALQETNNISFLPTSNDQIIAYLKSDPIGNDHLLCIVNLDPHHVQNGWVNIPYEQLRQGGTSLQVHDLLQEGSYTWDKDWNYVELDPGNKPAHIFRFSNGHS